MQFFPLSLFLWLVMLLPAFTQTAKSPYIGNDSLRIIPLKESVLYLTQWNRLELQSTLYGKDYKPVIMQVSGAKYRMDEKEKNVLWMMPDSGSQKITLRVGKYMKNGIAFKVKDFEFKAVNINMGIQIKINGKIFCFNSIKYMYGSDTWKFEVIPDSNMVKQCPEIDKYKYWVEEIDIWGGHPPFVRLAKQKLSQKDNSFNLIHKHKDIAESPYNDVIFKLNIFKTDSSGISTDITEQVSVSERYNQFKLRR